MRETFRPAVLAILTKKDKILIGSSPRDGGYKFPQGGLKENETPSQGIKRELFEELGIKIKDSDIIQELSNKVRYYFPKEKRIYSKHKGQELIGFIIKYNESMDIFPKNNEFDELIWIKPEEIINYDTKHRTKVYRDILTLFNLI